MSPLERAGMPRKPTDVVETILQWCSALPLELQIHAIQHWSTTNAGLLVLLAFSFHVECMVYRLTRNRQLLDGSWLMI